jgi:5-methyltetrahydrofolate--homocysteine methyltransferase
VLDLGVDVPADRFARTAKEKDARIIGISALLSTAVPMSMDVVKELEKDGCRSQSKIILGGASVRQTMTETYHVDAAVVDVTEGLNIIKAWTS